MIAKTNRKPMKMPLPGAIAAAILLSFGSEAQAQSGSIGASVPIQGMGVPASASSRAPFGDRTPSDLNPLSSATREQIEKGRETDRQRRMVADTNRLLALATQLRSDADKTTRDTATVDDIKKAEEIEKLAHSVKERMKN